MMMMTDGDCTKEPRSSLDDAVDFGESYPKLPIRV
jgi:hypothetical protein